MPTKAYSLYAPDGLVMPAELNPKQQLYGRLLVSLVLGRFAFRRQDARGFGRLKAAYLHRYIPAAMLRAIRGSLVRNGILVIDGYIKGVRSFGFRLGDAWIHRPIVRHDCPCPRLSTRLRKLQAQNDKLPRGAVYRHLRDMFSRLEVDVDRVHAVCSSLGRPELALVAMSLFHGESPYRVCPYGRFHSSLTRMKRELRPCLSVSGVSLVNVDIVNSQPVFLALQLISEAKKKAGGRQEKGKGARDDAITIGDWTDVEGPHGVAPSLSQDEMEYISLCEDGQLYEVLGGLWGLSRSDTKRTTYRIMMGRNRRQDRETQAFRERFPGVWRHIRKVKRKGHRHMAHRLQRDESNLIICGVCDQLRRIDPAIPLFTIHDSIMTVPEYVDVVQAVIGEQMEQLGIRVQLKVEGMPAAQGGPA